MKILEKIKSSRWTFVILIAVVVAIGIFYLESDISRDDFYKREFVKVTGQAFPLSGRFLKVESGDWDAHGDHDTCMLIQVSPEDLRPLLDAIKSHSSSGERSATLPCSRELYDQIAGYKFGLEAYSFKEGGEFKRWAISDSLPIILVEYSSW